MTQTSQPARYAVVGNPVAHSLSPSIHANFAAQTQQHLSYDAIEVARDGFAAAVDNFRQQNFAGINVTIPFKREAWALCDNLSSRAELAGAVNTLSFMSDGRIYGDNTDGVGLTRDLTNNLRLRIATRKILLLGAGGAVRGVLGPLLALAPDKITIANRTVEKAVALAQDFRHLGQVDALAYPELPAEGYDLIINGTATGLSNELPPISNSLLRAANVCYDMMYDLKNTTVFVARARREGVEQAYDGLGMLVEQAAEAFLIWRNINPDSVGVIESLRQA